MTRSNAEKAASSSARILGKPYGVFEMASGEYIPMQLPIRHTSTHIPHAEQNMVEVRPVGSLIK